MVSPADATRVGSRLSSRACNCRGSKAGAGSGGFFGGVGVGASACLGSGFLVASFLIASAIGSDFGCAVSFFGAGFGSGGVGGVSVAAFTSFLSSLAAGSGAGVASATFSAIGLGFSDCAAFLVPFVICVNSDTLMISIGNASTGGTWNGCAANVSTLHSSTPACAAPDIVRPVLIPLPAGPNHCSTSV